MKKSELMAREEQFERERRFSEHVDPPSTKGKKKVSDDYDYLRPGLLNQIGTFFSVGLFRNAGRVIAGYCGLKIVGKENLRGVRSAVLTCNHINKIDCALVKSAVPYRRLRITVGEFNNWSGVFGAMLRAGGTMPFGSTRATLCHLNAAVSEYLKKGSFVLFYPEGALWWCYEKPRPMLDGAFYTAAKNGVPVVPMFFTFKNVRKRRDGSDVKQFTLHIGRPVYPDGTLSVRENILRMRHAAELFCDGVYTSAYGHRPFYLPPARHPSAAEESA